MEKASEHALWRTFSRASPCGSSQATIPEWTIRFSCRYPCSSVCIRGCPRPCLHRCLSVFISGCNRICLESSRVLYISTTCRRQFWNLRDANIESLAPAAHPSLDGYHGPHTEDSAHIRCAYPDESFFRGVTLGRANPQENDARRKNRAVVCHLVLRRVPFRREPRV